MIKINSNTILKFALFSFFIFLFLLIYFPVTRGYYFSNEDYDRIWIGRGEKHVNAPSYFSLLRVMRWEGRPLETLYTYLVFNKYINPLKSVEAANKVRFVSIIGIGLLAYMLYLIFKESGFGILHAFLLSILTCTLPPFQIYVSKVYLTGFVYNAILSILASLILFKTVFKENSRRVVYIVIAVLIAIILLVAALSIYQPVGMVYWTMAVIPLLIINDGDFIRKKSLPFIIYFFTGFASMIIYFKVTKIISLLINNQMVARGSLILRGQIYERIVWFITYPFYGALNLWNIFPTYKVAVLISTVIVAGILYSFGRVVWQIRVEKGRASLLLNVLIRYLLVLIVILLSYTPHFAARAVNLNSMPPHRTLIGLEIAIMLLSYCGLVSIAKFSMSILRFSDELQKKVITVGLIILTIVVALLANHNVDKYVAKLHTDEYRYMKDVIHGYGVPKLLNTSKIYIIDPEEFESSCRYEFGCLNANARFSAIYMAKLALSEIGINSNIPIDYIFYDNKEDFYKRLPEKENTDTLVIDMIEFKKVYSGFVY